MPPRISAVRGGARDLVAAIKERGYAVAAASSASRKDLLTSIDASPLS
jgi:hypothetical protein